MAASPALGIWREQRRLADEHIRVAREFRQCVARAAVPGVRERSPVLGDAKAERQHLVVQDAMRRHASARRLERLTVRVLLDLEGALEHVVPAEIVAEARECLAAAGGYEEARPGKLGRRPELESPHP